MLPNIEEYLPYLEGLALSADEKKQFILTVWHLMEHQVNMAFDHDSVTDDVIIDTDTIH